MTRPEYLNAYAPDPFICASGEAIWDFFMACHDGNLHRVQDLASLNPRLVHASIHYHVPLHFALRENHLDIARYLLDLGADPLCDGFTYFDLRELLAERGQSDALELLNSTIAKKHSVSKEGEATAQLIRDRNPAALVELLDAQPRLVHTGDSSGTLPLHWAVMTRQLPVIDLLLERGALIDATRPDGAKAIYLTNGDYHYRGWRDLPSGTIRPHLVLVGYLLAKGAHYDIWTAARLGDLDRVQQELARDPTLLNQLPSYSGFYNSAPLRNAVRHGHHGVAKFLLDQGADPNLPESIAPHGAILRDAISGEYWEIVRMLLDYGANPNSMVDSSGNCIWAAKQAPAEIRQLLAQKGGVLGLEMACYDHDYDYIEAQLTLNPIAAICEFLPLDDQRMVELVLRFQPDVLSRRALPADIALPQAQWLLARGLSPSLPNWLGVTPLHECARRGNFELAQLCLDHGAPPNPVDDHFRETPLQWAGRFNQPAFASQFQTLISHGSST